jgi:hypothetical protein
VWGYPAYAVIGEGSFGLAYLYPNVYKLKPGKIDIWRRYLFSFR